MMRDISLQGLKMELYFALTLPPTVIKKRDRGIVSLNLKIGRGLLRVQTIFILKELIKLRRKIRLLRN